MTYLTHKQFQFSVEAPLFHSPVRWPFHENTDRHHLNVKTKEQQRVGGYKGVVSFGILTNCGWLVFPGVK